MEELPFARTPADAVNVLGTAGTDVGGSLGAVPISSRLNRPPVTLRPDIELVGVFRAAARIERLIAAAVACG